MYISVQYKIISKYIWYSASKYKYVRYISAKTPACLGRPNCYYVKLFKTVCCENDTAFMR